MDNGWRKDGQVEVNAGYPGDDAQGDTYTAYYAKPGTDWKADITYYAVGYPDPLGPPEDHTEWGVDGMYQIYRRDEDGNVFDEEITYEGENVMAIETLDAAVDYARRMAERDESHIFNI